MAQASHYLRGKGSAIPILDGDAIEEDVMDGKTFYNTDPNTKLTGTAILQSDHFHTADGLQAIVSIDKIWDTIAWSHEHAITIDKSWEIV